MITKDMLIQSLLIFKFAFPALPTPPQKSGSQPLKTYLVRNGQEESNLTYFLFSRGVSVWDRSWFRTDKTTSIPSFYHFKDYTKEKSYLYIIFS